MAESSGLGRRVISLLLLAGTALGLYNVYSDNADVKELAQQAACGTKSCGIRFTEQSRTPIGQSFVIQTHSVQQGKHDATAEVSVQCRRAFYLVGDYQCTAAGRDAKE